MTDELGALTVIFTEFYYWITVVLMFLIHVGFCMYEVGASRYKHHQSNSTDDNYQCQHPPIQRQPSKPSPRPTKP